MKKAVSFLLIIIPLISNGFIATAKTQLTITASDTSINNNRLFEVAIYAECNESLAAATFEITYDSNLFEYRKVTTDITNCQVKAVDNNGITTAIFLSPNGIDKNNKVKIFFAQFKAVNIGQGKVNIKAYDCVDNQGKELNCQVTTTCSVSVEDGSTKEIKHFTDKDKPVQEKSIRESNIDESEHHIQISSSNDKSQNTYLITIVLLIILVIAISAFHIASVCNRKEKLDENEN